MNRLAVNSFIFVISCIFSSSALANTPSNKNTNPLADNYTGAFSQFYGLKTTRHLTLLKVKGYQQTENYTCGPASVMSLMHFYGLLKDNQMNHKTELKIAAEMNTSKKTGTSPQQMVTWLEHHGFNVKSGQNGTVEMLQNNLKKGIPVMVDWADWGGHWVVTTGYNDDKKDTAYNNDSIYFADPSVHFDNVKSMNGILVFNPERFESMWFDAQFFNPGHLVKGIYIIATPKNKA